MFRWFAAKVRGGIMGIIRIMRILKVVVGCRLSVVGALALSSLPPMPIPNPEILRDRDIGMGHPSSLIPHPWFIGIIEDYRDYTV